MISLSVLCAKVVPINLLPLRVFLVYRFCVFSSYRYQPSNVHKLNLDFLLSECARTSQVVLLIFFLNFGRLSSLGIVVIVVGGGRRCSGIRYRGGRSSCCHATLSANFFATLELSFLAELGDPLASRVLEVFQKVGIPATELTNYRSFLNLCLAGRHDGIRKL